MLSTFAIMGIAQQLTTENGPDFTSSLFKMFCSQWEIAHNTQGQGIIEHINP